ncbi:MAG: FimV/HubP family polar landmark protein [Pseudomonas sp.]
MARIRHILLTLASGSALYSGMVPALGLGEINLHSALNQPLEADIELIQADEFTADEIKVRLASAEDFNRSGVDRFIFLNDLRFTPVLRGGRQIIRVVSSKPVREPYLNFIVELARPGGNLLREYTLLIDPPSSSAYRPVAAPFTSTAAAPRDVPAQPQPRQAPARPLPAAIQGQHYSVQSGDSLWSIAGRLPGSQSREALMADIQALNPQAFIAGDRNRLRAQAQLLLPDYLQAAQVEASAPASQAAAPSQPVPAPQPEIADPAILATQREVDAELASTVAQNQELKQAIDQLQLQLQQLQQQMADKDRQLTQIQNDLAQRVPVEAAVQAAPVAAEPPAVVAPAAPLAEASSPWASWLGAGALCLILVGGIWLLARRRDPQQEPEPLRQAQPRPSLQPAAMPAVRVAQPAQPRVVAPAAAPAPRVPVATDALEGANIYIAYGRFSEAALALRAAVEQEPQRLDLRLRLFEVLGELGDANGFVSQERSLHELGANPAQIEQIRARYPNLQATPAAELDDVVLHLDEPTPLASAAQDDFQLNLDDLSLDADWGLDSPFKPDAPTRVRVVEPALDASFRSNLSELPEVFELTMDKDLISPFGEPAVNAAQDEVLDEEFLDAFATDSAGQGPLAPDSNLEHLAGNREHLARLNMALAYIEQGDIGSACDILNEVISNGGAQEQQRARELLAKIA